MNKEFIDYLIQENKNISKLQDPKGLNTHDLKKDLREIAYKLKKEQEHFEYLESNNIKSKLDTHESILYWSFDSINKVFKKHYDLDIDWLRQGLLKQGSSKKGKYDFGNRIFFIQFLSLMIHRGASKTQSINVLAEIMKENAAPQGFYREVRDTYNELVINSNMNYGVLFNEHFIVFLIESLIIHSKVSNISLENKEESFKKAYKIYANLLNQVLKMIINYNDFDNLQVGRYGSISKENMLKFKQFKNKSYSNILEFVTDLQSISDNVESSSDLFKNFALTVNDHNGLMDTHLGFEETDEFLELKKDF